MAIDELDLSFRAWCATRDRSEAFAAAVSALAYPGQPWPFHLSIPGSRGQRGGPLPVEEIIAAARTGFTSQTEMDVGFSVELCSGRGELSPLVPWRRDYLLGSAQPAERLRDDSFASPA